MSGPSASVDDVIRLMNGMVASDGGELTLDHYDADAQAITVRYAEGVNEECETCAISAEMVKVFLTDSLVAHGVPITSVTVESNTR